MIARPLWNERVAAAWKQAPIVWLTGPRRIGKTVLAQSIPDAFETRGLAAFREHYPNGNNFVVSPLNGPAYERGLGGMKIRFVSPGELRLHFR